jgi:hypothetical protein
MLSENPNSNFFPIVANNNKSIDESIQNFRLFNAKVSLSKWQQ